MANPIQINNLELPVAPHLLIQLVEICTNPDVSFEELEAVISKDSALTAKVISIANSAAYSQWKDEFNLKRILIVLGVKTVKSIALASAVHQFFSKLEPQLGKILGSLWLESLVCSNITESLAELVGYSQVEQAQIVGLLHNIGRLILINHDHEAYCQLQQQSNDLQTQLTLEQKTFSLNCADLAGDVFSHWGLTSEFENAVRYQYTEHELMLDMPLLSKLLNVAATVSFHHNQSTISDFYFGLNQAVIDNIVTHAKLKAVEQAKSFGIEVKSDNDRLSTTLDSEKVRIDLAKQVHKIALIDASNNELLMAETLTEVVTTISNQLALLFGFTASSFYFTDDKQSKLSHYNHRKELQKEDTFLDLVENQSLIAQSLLSQKVLSSEHQTIFKQLSIIDRQAMRQLGSDEMFCLPMHFKGKNLGVVIAGCHQQKANELINKQHLLYYFCHGISMSIFRATESVNTQQQAIEQSKEETKLRIRSIVHEVSNPLTIVNNYLEALSVSNDDINANSDTFKIIKSEIARIGTMLTQFRDDELSEENKESCDLNKLINKLLSLLKPTLFKTQKIQYTLKLDSQNPVINCDQNLLKQALLNLLKNAAEALPENGCITIQSKGMVVSNNSQYASIIISDNGDGLPAHVIKNLFNPVETTKGKAHSGLGLSIVYRLIKKLNGHVSYSGSSSSGAEFSLLIPLVK